MGLMLRASRDPAQMVKNTRAKALKELEQLSTNYSVGGGEIIDANEISGGSEKVVVTQPLNFSCPLNQMQGGVQN